MRRGLANAAQATLCRTGLWRAYLRLRPPRRTASAAIVTFHRLVDDATPYLFKGPTVQTNVGLFERIVATLARTYRVVSLGEVVRHLAAGEPFARDCVAVVFDDGYEDNHRLGLPVLRRYGVPATVFVTTGVIDTGARMWSDRVEQALLGTRAEALDLGVLGLEGAEGRLPLCSREDRRLANLQMSRLIKDLDRARASAALDRLEEALGADPDRYPRTMLTWEEVRALAEAGWEIGSHGVSHTIMTRLPHAEAVAELEQSKRTIERELGNPVRHFAFPNGREEDFDASLTDACRRIGYQSVASCLWGVNRPGRDAPFAMKRVGVGGGFPKGLLAVERQFRVAAAEP